MKLKFYACILARPRIFRRNYYFSSFGPCTIVDSLCCVEDDFGVLVVVPGPPRCRVLCSAGATWSDVNTPPNVDINS